MDGTKQAIRQEMRRRRRALSAADAAAAERAVAGHVEALAAFRAADCGDRVRRRPTTRCRPAPCIEAAFAAGKRVYLPRLVGETMSFAEHRRGADLRPGAFGIPEPLGDQLEERDVAATVAFVPLLAWDDIRVAGGTRRRPLRPRLCRSGPARVPGRPRIHLPAVRRAAARSVGPPARLGGHGARRGALLARGRSVPVRERRAHSAMDISGDGAGHHRAGRRAGLAGGLPPAPTG